MVRETETTGMAPLQQQLEIIFCSFRSKKCSCCVVMSSQNYLNSTYRCPEMGSSTGGAYAGVV